MTINNEQIQALLEKSESDNLALNGNEISNQLRLTDLAIDAAEMIDKLLAERDVDKALIAEYDDALCKLLPGVQYMDPPDGGNVTPLDQVARMVADYRQHIAELSAHLRNAHAFIENTEAFGGEAATGIIKCGGAEWNIDASKAALVSVEN